MFSGSLIYIGISIILIVIFIPFAGKIKYHFILLIAALNVLTAITSAYFPEGDLHTGIIRAIVMILFFVYYIPKLELDLTTKIIIIYLVYLAILIPFSSNAESTLSAYIRHGISLMMFPIAFAYFQNINNIHYLYFLTIISLTLIIFNYFVA